MLDRLSYFFRLAPKPALLGLLLIFCAGFADGMLVPFFPLWANDEAGVPVGAIGLLFGCYAGGELIAAPLIGGIADRVGRRPVLIASSLGVGGGFAALFFAHGVVLAAVVLLLVGMCESVLHPTIYTVIGDVTPENDHRHWFSLARVGSGAGRILGPAFGAALALWSLGAVFLAAGGVLLFGCIAMFLWLTETIKLGSGKDEEDEEEGLSALLPVFRDRRLAGLLLWFILFEVASSWIESVLPLYARDAGILTPSGIGALFAFESALVVGLQMLVSRSVKNLAGLSGQPDAEPGGQCAGLRCTGRHDHRLAIAIAQSTQYLRGSLYRIGHLRQLRQRGAFWPEHPDLPLKPARLPCS